MPPPRCSSARATSTPQGRCTEFGVATATAKRHEARKAKKAVEVDAKAIENRIRYFQKEEEKVWRDLEEVRRQAASIESGRARALEKKLADRVIQEERDSALQENKTRVAERRRFNHAVQERSAAYREAVVKERQLAAQRQRMASVEVLQRMRMEEMEARLRNSERVVVIQRERLEAATRNSEQRDIRLARIKQQQDAERQQAEVDAIDAETVIPSLEAREIECLQRLQNSRQISQSVLQELETSLGAKSPVATLLRNKQRDHPDILHTPSVLHASKSVIEEDEEEQAPEDISVGLGAQHRPDSFLKETLGIGAAVP